VVVPDPEPRRGCVAPDDFRLDAGFFVLFPDEADAFDEDAAADDDDPLADFAEVPRLASLVAFAVEDAPFALVAEAAFFCPVGRAAVAFLACSCSARCFCSLAACNCACDCNCDCDCVFTCASVAGMLLVGAFDVEAGEDDIVVVFAVAVAAAVNAVAADDGACAGTPGVCLARTASAVLDEEELELAEVPVATDVLCDDLLPAWLDEEFGRR